MDIFYHERLHRTEAVMARLRALPVTVCGAGALGANLTETLARQGFARLTVVDRDRVEERNLSTQPYYRGDIGAQKAKILANALYRALGVTVNGRVEELTPANAAKLLTGAGLVVDTFDNSAARRAVTDACTALGLPCLHVGLAAGYAEILWNDGYRVPSPVNDDVCDYPLARNLVLLTVAVAAEIVARFAAVGEQAAYTITLDDFAVRAYDARE
jgi:molybdopterin/thiamine biosynthesis adenylyltransferase